MPEKLLHAEPEFTLGTSSLATDKGTGRNLSIAKRSNRPKIAVLAVFALALGAGAIYFFWPRNLPLPRQTVPTLPAAGPIPIAEPEPAIKYPVDKILVPSATDNGHLQTALPELDSSDIVARDVIQTILNGDAYLRLLVPNGIIRHIVATIDNLPRKTLTA